MVINSGQQHSTVNSFVETTECSLLCQTIRIDTKLLSNHLPPGSIQFALDHCQESSERKKIQLSSEITCVHWRALTILLWSLHSALVCLKCCRLTVIQFLVGLRADQLLLPSVGVCAFFVRCLANFAKGERYCKLLQTADRNKLVSLKCCRRGLNYRIHGEWSYPIQPCLVVYSATVDIFGEKMLTH